MLKYTFLAIAYFFTINFVDIIWGEYGLVGGFLEESSWLFVLGYVVLVSHITITCMSLSFHRHHTHKGIIINKTLDMIMQTWLWFITSMSKSDWVSVHIYHHAHSDKEKDPHSPVQKGFWRVFFGGAYDYGVAAQTPQVRKLRKAIPENKIEAFFDQNKLLGLVLTTVLCLILFGPIWGTLFSIINFLISPILAVGGVNTIAHFFGYQNHHSGDNSRNIGYLFPLNFIICGELDHNNHHKYPKSCSFRHKWYEFDIGYVYIKALNALGLVEIKNVYNTKKFKEELSEKVAQMLEYDAKFRARAKEMAEELDINWEEFKQKVVAYVQGKKSEMDESMKLFIKELKRAAQANIKMNLSFQ